MSFLKITKNWYNMPVFELNQSLGEISGIGTKFLPKLKHLHVETVRDLLWHFPNRYEDYSEIYQIADLHANQDATIQGVVSDIKGRQSWQRRLYIVEALISDESGSIRAIWFNQPYIKNVLRTGRVANFSGKVVFRDGEIYLSNPTYELVSTNSNRETRHTARIVPIYPETSGLTSKGLRYLIKPILDNLETLTEIIPPQILGTHNLLDINNAVRSIHFPASIDEALAAKKRFAFEDLFLLQLYNIKQKMLLRKKNAPKISENLGLIKSLIASLPFELTKSQKQSLWEIAQDLGKPHPMNRLLQGDVGSGKTIVAAIAAICAAKSEYQSAFMAPTEILARQHYETFKKFFAEISIPFGLVTSGEARVHYESSLEDAIPKNKFVSLIRKGDVKIIIGTHALIQKSIMFRNLGLVVVDEQHRFGVKQRAELLQHNKNSHDKNAKSSPLLVPHFLSMSATPIPRTLSLTLFGDLDLSLITELPKDRKTIITKVVEPEERNKAYAFIRQQVKGGRQVFVICPRIEKPEEIEESSFASEWQRLEVKSVKVEYEKLSKKIFPTFKVAMLHGKLRAQEKESVMRGFKNGAIDIIVATSVVEVGVDIPNATVMMIEGTERFGLAQLYQFRGRVGRGVHQSYCFLFTDSKGESTKKRLRSIVEAKNGFELAEKDLEIRGPGQFLGASQTGMPDLAMKAIQNPELVASAREAAKTILEKNPTLAHHPELKERLNLFESLVHWE